MNKLLKLGLARLGWFNNRLWEAEDSIQNNVQQSIQCMFEHLTASTRQQKHENTPSHMICLQSLITDRKDIQMHCSMKQIDHTSVTHSIDTTPGIRKLKWPSPRTPSVYRIMHFILGFGFGGSSCSSDFAWHRIISFTVSLYAVMLFVFNLADVSKNGHFHSSAKRWPWSLPTDNKKYTKCTRLISIKMVTNYFERWTCSLVDQITFVP